MLMLENLQDRYNYHLQFVGSVYLDWLAAAVFGMIVILLFVRYLKQDRSLLITCLSLKLLMLLLILPGYYATLAPDTIGYVKWGYQLYQVKDFFESMNELLLRIFWPWQQFYNRDYLFLENISYFYGFFLLIFQGFLVMNVFFIMVTTLCFKLLFKALEQKVFVVNDQNRSRITWIKGFILFYPASFFWTSLLGKEIVIFILFTIITYAFSKIRDGKSFRLSYLLIMLFAIYEIGFIRTWMAKILSLSLFTYMYFRILYYFSRRHLGLVLVILLLTVGSLQLAVVNVETIRKLPEIISLQASYFVGGQSDIGHWYVNDFWEWLIKAPQRTFVVLYEPFFWESISRSTVSHFLYSLNAMFMVMIFLFIAFRVLLEPGILKILFTNKLICFWFSYFVVFFLIYHLILHTNIGAASRFKSQGEFAYVLVLAVLLYEIVNRHDIIRNN